MYSTVQCSTVQYSTVSPKYNNLNSSQTFKNLYDGVKAKYN